MQLFDEEVYTSTNQLALVAVDDYIQGNWEKKIKRKVAI